jgi:hypothetical protein
MEDMQIEMWKRYGNYGRKVSWIVKTFGKYRRKLWKDMKNMEKSKLNREMIWKIWKKISWNLIRYGKYGRNVIWYGKYGKQLWKDMENMEKRQVE